MPDYNFRCGKCKHEFELFLSIRDETVPPCPNCGNTSSDESDPERVHRLIGSCRFILKGKGWAKDGYR